MVMEMETLRLNWRVLEIVSDSVSMSVQGAWALRGSLQCTLCQEPGAVIHIWGRFPQLDITDCKLYSCTVLHSQL